MIHGARTYSANEITSAVKGNIGDTGEKSDGYFNGMIVRALKELALDTFFDHRDATFEVPDDLLITVPKDFAGFKKVFAYSGNTCEPSAMTPAYYHEGMTRKGAGAFFAENRGYNNTPVTDNLWYFPPTGLLYFNQQSGSMALSNTFLSYERVYMEYNGLGVDFGEEPFIPAFAQQAIIDWVSVEALRPKVAENPGRWMSVKRDAELSLYGDGRRRGSWAEAKKRVQQIDQKGVNDLTRTLGSFGTGQ